MSLTNRVLLIYTGGTIGMGRNPKTGALEPFDFNHLNKSLPELSLVEAQVDVCQFSPVIDSSNMSPELWAKLIDIITRKYNSYDGFVILHGTDTMAYTASALSFMLQNLTKPVILTGSQLPMGQLRTDGKENVLTSLEIASAHREDGHPIVPEVCIYFSGRLIRGNRATKINAEGFHAFDSFNCPRLCDAGVNFKFNYHTILQPDYSKPMTPHKSMSANVIVFSLFPGIQESIFSHIIDASHLRGIVMRTYGSGNAPQCEWLKNLLTRAKERGIVVVNVTQCVRGSVEMGLYDTGYQLKEAGVISGKDMTVEAAVTKLMHLLGSYVDVDIVRQKMAQCLAGEITL